MRADSLSKFEDGRLLDSGTMPCNDGLMSEILAYEVIPAKYKSEFNGILDKKENSGWLPSRTINKGYRE